MSAWWFWAVRFSRRLIVRASAYGLFAVVAALAAVWFAPLVPEELSERLGGEAVEGVLTALASSLLAVATFSLSAMVVAYTAAAAQLTPRAASFVTTDSATQGALATFVGAFLFTIVALVALGADYYGAQGRTILFLATLLMVAIVAVRLIGWIDRVSRLAQHGHLLAQIEAAARAALRTQRARRHLGGEPLAALSEQGLRVAASKAGYVANIDPGQLQQLAETLDAIIEVAVRPGDFVVHGDTLANVVGASALSPEQRDDVCSAFTLSPARTIDQDPLYAMQILTEVAARALSPGVNDPGTAILVVDCVYRLLEAHAEDGDRTQECAFDRLRARDLDGCDLVEQSLGAIARYGAGDVAVALRVQDAFSALARNGGALSACARAQSALALERALLALALEADRARVRAAALSSS